MAIKIFKFKALMQPLYQLTLSGHLDVFNSLKVIKSVPPNSKINKLLIRTNLLFPFTPQMIQYVSKHSVFI